MSTLIANAKTPEDHEKIAAYYRDRAAQAKAEAAEHEKMLAAYNQNPSTSPSCEGGGRTRGTLPHLDPSVSTTKRRRIWLWPISTTRWPRPRRKRNKEGVEVALLQDLDHHPFHGDRSKRAAGRALPGSPPFDGRRATRDRGGKVP